jgi:lysozyme
LVKEFEGFSLKAYRCPAGVWTVGWGCTGRDIREGTTWTQPQAEAELLHRARAVAAGILKAARQPPTQGQLDALVSLAFNIGEHALLTQSSVWRHHQLGEYAEAQAAFAKWNKITVKGVKVESPGLVRRRAAEAKLYGS